MQLVDLSKFAFRKSIRLIVAALRFEEGAAGAVEGADGVVTR